MKIISSFFFLSLRVALAVFMSVKVQHLLKEDKVKLSVDSYTYFFWAFLV